MEPRTLAETWGMSSAELLVPLFNMPDSCKHTPVLSLHQLIGSNLVYDALMILDSAVSYQTFLIFNLHWSFLSCMQSWALSDIIS